MGILRYLSGRARTATAGGGGESGPDTLIGQYTIHAQEGVATSGAIVEFGWPNIGSAMPVGKKIKVVCSGAVLPFQVDNTRSNMDDGLERFRKITALVTALDSAAGTAPVKVLDIYASDDAYITGTPIGVADMQALSVLTSGLIAVEITDEASAVFTADLKTIFTSGTTTWSKTGKWICPDLIRSGPYCTEWRVRMAPETTAGVLHGATGGGAGDGVHVEMHVAAYKGHSSGVSASNPIVAVRANVCPQNEDAGRSFLSAYPTSNTARNHWYGLNVYRATDISVPTLINTQQTSYPYGLYTMSYPLKYPAGSLSVTDTGAGNMTPLRVCRMKLSGATFDTDIMGAHIHTSTGRAIVVSVSSNTEVEAYSYQTFTSTTFPANSWKQYGVGHSYNTRYFVPVWVGRKPSHVGFWGNHASLNTSVSDAGMRYLGQSEMCFETLLSAGNITHTAGLALLSVMAAPDGTMRPLTNKGNTYAGELLCGIASGGGRADIAWIPGWEQAGLLKPDANGRKRIFRNAECWNWQYSMPIRMTGPTPPDGNPTLPLKNNCRWSSGGINTIAANYNFLRDMSGENWWGYDSDTAHQPAPHYVPYLLTGDYHWWFWAQQQEAWTCWLSRQVNIPGGDGTSTTRNWTSRDAGTIFSSFPTRGRAWPGRDQQMLAAIEPDSERSWLSNGKAYVLSRLSAAADGHAYWINDPRLISPLTGPVYDIRENIGGVPVGVASASALDLKFSTPWTVGFWGLTVGAMKYLGLNNSNWETFAPWLVRFWTESVSVSTVVFDIWTETFQHIWGIQGSLAPNLNGVYPTSTGEIYRRTILVGPTNPKAWGEYRTVSGTYSITNPASGTGRTLTLPTSVFVNASSYYVDGYIRDMGAGTAKYNSRTGALFVAGDKVHMPQDAGYIVSAFVVTLLSDDGSAGEFIFHKGRRNSTLSEMSEYSGGGVVSASNGAAALFVTPLYDNVHRPVARITSVVDPRTVEVEVIERFSDTSVYTYSMAVPGPHPNDYDGSRSVIAVGEAPYHNRAGVVALTKYVGIVSTAPWLSALAARTNFDAPTYGPWFYWKAK